MFNERTWKDGEKLAQKYLKNKGYKIKYTNYNAGGVELDIVAVLTKKQQLKLLKKDTKKKLKIAPTLGIKEAIIKQAEVLEKEIDDLLIICEVKARRIDNFGMGFDAVDELKMARQTKGAQFLLKQKEFEGFSVRFDVASVDGNKVSYIENAFQAK